MPAIFISYRRGDASGYAGRLRESLDRRLGAGRVFRDVDTIQPGQDFVEVIETRVGECRALLALIGQEWLAAADAAGNRRLNLAGDFVTLEIASALKRPDVLVVPVLVEGARMPEADALPESIRRLAYRQAVAVRDETWDEDIDRLAAVLVKQVGGVTARPDESHASAPAQRWNPTSIKRLALGIGIVAIVTAVALSVGRFRRDDAASAGGRSVVSGAVGSAERARSRTDGAAYGIEIPRVCEFAVGSVIHSVLSGSVTPRGEVSEVRLRVRFSNEGNYPANFWDSSYRMLIGDQMLAPTSRLDEVVAGHAFKDGIVSFDVPAQTSKVALRVESQESKGTLPLDLSSSGRPAASEETSAGDARPRPIVARVAEGPRTLASSGSASYSLVSVTSRRFVNTLRVIFTIRMANRTRYPRNFSTDSVRLLIDGLPTAPIDGPNDTVAANSSSGGRDFVFDLSVSTERLVLRTTADDAVSEVPFDLQAPQR